MHASLRAIGCSLVAAVCAAAVIAPAQAGGQCWRVIMEEWSSSGSVSTSYDIQCYEAAVANAPDDLLIYSSFEGDVFSAKRRAVRSQSRGGGSGSSASGSSPSGGSGGSSQAEPAAPQESSGGAKPKNGKKTGNGDGDSKDAEASGAGEDDPDGEDALTGVASGDPPEGGTGEPNVLPGGSESEGAGSSASDGAEEATPATAGAVADDLDAEAVADLEIVDGGSIPVALIALVVVAALLAIGGGAALLMRRRDGEPQAELRL